MQQSPRRPSSASPSRSRAESAAAASWSSVPPAAGSRRSTDGRRRRWRCIRRRSGRTDRPLPFNDARYSGLSVGVPGTVETWADALEKYGTMSLAEVFAPAIHVARHGYVIDQVWFDQVNANRDWFDDIPASAALFLDPDGTPRDVGTVFTNPALAKTYERIAHLGAKGFYRGAVADALVETVQHPVVSPSANHVWRSGVMKMRDLHTYAAPGAGSDPRQLPRARRLLDGPAVERRLDRRGGTEHPRGLQPRVDDEGGRPALLPRGLALLLRGPQRVPRRSGLLRRASHRAALGGVRGDPARADHGDRSARACPAWGSVSVRGRRDDHPSDDVGQVREPSSRTRSRSNRPAARDSSSRATGSCSTTS